MRAHRARPPALRRRPRRHRDPPGGRGSTSARCRSPRAATSARRRSRGCYYRGKPNRQLRGLRLSAPADAGDAAQVRRPRGRARSASVARLAAARPDRAGARAPRGAARRPVSVGADGADGRGRRAAVRLSRARTLERSTAPAADRARAAASSGCEARYVATIRTSSTSSGGTCAPSSPARPPRASAARGALASCRSVAGSGPQSTSRPPTSQNAVAARRRPGARRAPAAAARGSPRARRRAARGSTRSRRAAPAQPRRPLVALLGRGGAHLRLDVVEQRARRRRRRRTAAAPRRAGGGRGSGPGRPGTATGSGPSARRPTGCSRRGSRRPQWRSPNSESSCSTSSRASRRPRSGPIVTAWPGRRLGGDLEDRERDVEPAADVHEPVVAACQADVAGRAQLLDQPVLEHQRARAPSAWLGSRRSRRARSTAAGARRGREVRARPAADRDRLADVQRRARRRRGTGTRRDRAAARAKSSCGRRSRRRRLRGALPGAGVAGRGARAARARRRPSTALAHSRGNSAHSTRAHVSASASARCASSTSIPSASASAPSRRSRCSGSSARASAAVHSTGGSGHSRPDALERLPQHAAVERRVVGDQHAARAAARQARGSTVLERRRAVDHRLRDAGEALDPAPQRHARAHQRRPAVVQLAAADQHRADLGQLARVAAEAVGLGVDDEELGGRDRLLEQVQATRDTPRAGRHEQVLADSRRLTTGWRGSIAPEPGKESCDRHRPRHESYGARRRHARGVDRVRERLRGLSGAEYERAEHESWTELQSELRRARASPQDAHSGQHCLSLNRTPHLARFELVGLLFLAEREETWAACGRRSPGCSRWVP